jgi:hypothetical protein
MSYTINFIFKDGTKWDQEVPSLIYPDKNCSGLEHIIMTGGMSLDTGIELLSSIKTLPVNIKEDDDPDNIYGANVVFHLGVANEELKNNVVKILEKTIRELTQEYTVSIDVIEEKKL